MKKPILILLFVIALALTACASQTVPSSEVSSSSQGENQIVELVPTTQVVPKTAAPTIPVEETNEVSAALSTDFPDAAPVQAQLIVGSFQLEGSQWAITGPQAVTMLPVWSALKDLAQNSAATQEQYKELIEQALQAMTDEQIQAISSMQITRESMAAMMEAEGISMNGMQPAGGAGPGSGWGAPPQGTPPAGMPGNGEGAPPEGGTPPDGMLPEGTPPTGALQEMGLLRVPSELLDAFIEFLTEKAAS